MVSWESIDTVLLDMDGTLLDLRFDNVLWTSLLPERHSQTHQLPLEHSELHLFGHMDETKGKLEFYCLDYWAEFTGLDVVELHHELSELIAYRPSAERFLDWLRQRGKRSVLVTNAHRDSLNIKNSHLDLTRRLDETVSCHDYGSPKEDQKFWRRLMAEHPFDPQRTLLIDDNHGVLSAAAEFGIAHLVTIAQPDSGKPPRQALEFPALHDFQDLLSHD
jgi:HAD superfamily hydrolase (TIGR01509 family)